MTFFLKKYRLSCFYEIVFYLIVSGWLIFNGTADAHGKIVSVQSIRVNPYEIAIRGFKRTCHADIDRLIISELNGIDLNKRIETSHPDAILAIGKQALQKVKDIQHIPVIYLMVLQPESILNGEKNITGVRLNIPLSRQLKILLNIMPECENIGILYNPENTGIIFKKIQAAAHQQHINLIAEKITYPGEVPTFLSTIGTDYDLFWILPDPTVVTPETIESFLLFSIEKKIPLVAFSRKYLEWGAMIAIGVDVYNLGSQAGKMAQKIISGMAHIDSLQPEYAQKANVAVNAATARKMGIHIDRRRLKDIDVVN